MAYHQRRFGVLREQGTGCNSSSVKYIHRQVSHDLFLYVQVREELESNGCQIKIGCEVSSISKSKGGKSIIPYI
jgi:hypothetical protein